MQRIFKCGGIQNIILTHDKELNILIYRTPSYNVIIWKSYTLFKMVRFFGPPCIVRTYTTLILLQQTLYATLMSPANRSQKLFIVTFVRQNDFKILLSELFISQPAIYLPVISVKGFLSILTSEDHRFHIEQTNTYSLITVNFDNQWRMQLLKLCPCSRHRDTDT